MIRAASLSAWLFLLAPSREALARPPVSLRVTEPADGAELVGGAIAALRWEAPAGALPAEFEEWEAFLSLDGGRTFSIRITPHLDADRRTVWWRVPNLASQNARLLLRFGDEHTETEIEPPQRLRIRRGTTSAWSPRSFARGESARADSPGVVAWVEGDRNARGWQEQEGAAPISRLGGGLEQLTASDSSDVAEEAPTSHAFAARSNRESFADALAPGRALRPPLFVQSSPDILRLTQRQNE